jgi:hypothetical protein
MGAAIVAAAVLLAAGAVLTARWLNGTETAAQAPIASSPGADPTTGSGGETAAETTGAVPGTGYDDPAVSRLDPADAVAGGLVWEEVAPGFEAAELAVVLGTEEVDKLLLSRIDPVRFRFQVISRPAGNLDVIDWLDTTDAVLAVNGSYFDPDGRPVAPVLTDSQPAGPSSYDAVHGAFVASSIDGTETATVVDLITTPWTDALAGAHDAMVSYPMLIGEDGQPRTGHADARQAANRTFVGSDTAGRIVIGTTIQAFFSLDRFGVFLADSPLELTTALNLDGGRLACQAVQFPTHEREYCGQLDTTRNDDGTLIVADPDLTDPRPALPLVLLVHPVDD